MQIRESEWKKMTWMWCWARRGEALAVAAMWPHPSAPGGQGAPWRRTATASGWSAAAGSAAAGSSPPGTSTKTIGAGIPGMPGTAIGTGTTKINASGFVPSLFVFCSFLYSFLSILLTALEIQGVWTPGTKSTRGRWAAYSINCSVQAGPWVLGCVGWVLGTSKLSYIPSESSTGMHVILFIRQTLPVADFY